MATILKIVIISLTILLAYIFIIEAQYNSYPSGYGNRYSSKGSLFGYDGLGWYSVLCPDRTFTPGRCQANLTCAKSGYICISPGICCRPSTQRSLCPNGLATIYTCQLGICLAGQICVAGRCCIANTSATCPNGDTGIGTCDLADSGLSCADGFTCTTINGQNVCCSKTANSPNNNATEHSCPGNQFSTNITCSTPNQCRRFTTSGTTGVCLNQHCCSETAVVSRRPTTMARVCPGKGNEPVHNCKNIPENNTCSPCPKNSFCKADSGFCCPYTEDMDKSVTCVH